MRIKGIWATTTRQFPDSIKPSLRRAARSIPHPLWWGGRTQFDFWGALDLSFLYPNALVADACYRLVEKYKKGERIDYRLSDTDLVHLGYALAYNVDYFLTTDTKLKYYVPERSKLQVIDHEAAKRSFEQFAPGSAISYILRVCNVAL